MVDWTKPLQTNGLPPKPARLICDDLKRHSGITRAVAVDHGIDERVYYVAASGFVPGCIFRIVNAPQRHNGYINVYRETCGRLNVSALYPTATEAAENADYAGFIIAAAVPVEFVEGQGL
jgi:hypothetical protein